MAIKNTKYGKAYNAPTGLQEDDYYSMMYDLMDYVSEKGLTTRQAQHLFTDCFDMVLDIKSTDNFAKTDYLKSISDSLDNISKFGVINYSSCFSYPTK